MALADVWMLGALLVGEERRGRLLDELLVAALQRAVAGADDDDVAVGVGEHLRLDVAGLVEVALDEALAAAERGDRLADGASRTARGSPRSVRATFSPRPPPPNAALIATGRPCSSANATTSSASVTGSAVPGTSGAPTFSGDVPGGDLVAERGSPRARADPGQPGVDDGLGEVGVLGEEAVAGVDGVGAGLLGGVEDLVDAQVGVAGRRAAEGERLVGERTCSASRSGSA